MEESEIRSQYNDFRKFYHFESALVRKITDKSVSYEEAETILNAVSEVLYIQVMMEHLRRFWSPQAGAGSQDVLWDFPQRGSGYRF